MKMLLGKIAWAFMISLLAFGMYSAVTESEIQPETLKDLSIENPREFSINFFLFAEGYNILTPAIQKDWLPPKDKYIFILEDFPYPDATDFIPIILGLLAGMLLSKLVWYIFDDFKQKHNVLSKVLNLLIFLITIIIFWIGWRIIWYNLMIQGGIGLGMTKEAILAARQKTIASTKDFAKVFMVVTLSSITVGLKWAAGLFKQT